MTNSFETSFDIASAGAAAFVSCVFYVFVVQICHGIINQRRLVALDRLGPLISEKLAHDVIIDLSDSREAGTWRLSVRI